MGSEMCIRDRLVPARRRPPDGGRPECSRSDGPLKSVAVPPVVIHGDADQLINATGSEAQAALSHDLRPECPQLRARDLITANAAPGEERIGIGHRRAAAK